MTERLHFHFSLSCIGEGNGNPLQYSCLENPRDGGSWWAAIYGVTQSQTQVKQLSSSRVASYTCNSYFEFFAAQKIIRFIKEIEWEKIFANYISGKGLKFGIKKRILTPWQ